MSSADCRCTIHRNIHITNAGQRRHHEHAELSARVGSLGATNSFSHVEMLRSKGFNFNSGSRALDVGVEHAQRLAHRPPRGLAPDAHVPVAVPRPHVPIRVLSARTRYSKNLACVHLILRFCMHQPLGGWLGARCQHSAAQGMAHPCSHACVSLWGWPGPGAGAEQLRIGDRAS
jgi:hypothetical protein